MVYKELQVYRYTEIAEDLCIAIIMQSVLLEIKYKTAL